MDRPVVFDGDVHTVEDGVRGGDIAPHLESRRDCLMDELISDWYPASKKSSTTLAAMRLRSPSLFRLTNNCGMPWNVTKPCSSIHSSIARCQSLPYSTNPYAGTRSFQTVNGFLDQPLGSLTSTPLSGRPVLSWAPDMSVVARHSLSMAYAGRIARITVNCAVAESFRILFLSLYLFPYSTSIHFSLSRSDSPSLSS